VVEIAPYLEQKLAAFRCHKTQIREDTFFMQLPPELARRTFSDEHFGLARSLVDVPTPENDLFAGLR